MNTNIDDVKDKFFALIITGEALPDLLVEDWLNTALGWYNMEFDTNLEIIKVQDGETTESYFNTILSPAQKDLLGRYMQKGFITREWSRYSKVTGIDSKDEKVSGLQATKQSLRAELEIAEANIAELVHKLNRIDN